MVNDYGEEINKLIMTAADGTETSIEVNLELEFDDSTIIYSSKYLTIDQIRGPWLSLGFHADFQGRFIEFHVGWWVFTLGRPYHKRPLAGGRAVINGG